MQLAQAGIDREHLRFQHFALTTTPRGLLRNALTSLLSQLLFFQLDLTKKHLVKYAGTDPNVLRFQQRLCLFH